MPDKPGAARVADEVKVWRHKLKSLRRKPTTLSGSIGELAPEVKQFTELGES